MSTRDLKPENILMHRANDSQTRGYVVKITDFGTQNRAVMMTLAVAVV
jgi:serine/threonine protein kinase